MYGLPGFPSAKEEIILMAIQKGLISTFYANVHESWLDFALDYVQRLAVMDNSRPILMKTGILKVIEPLAALSTTGKKLVASLILAL